MAAVTMHHFSGLGAPFVRSKGTVSGGVFSRLQIRPWTDRDGIRHYATEILANRVYFGDSRPAAEAENEPPEEDNYDYDDEGELPI